MRTKLYKLFIALLLAIFSFSFLNMVSPVYADVCGNENIPIEVRRASGCPETGDTKNALPDLIVGIINGIIAVSGVVAVVFVLIGGINYMTSAGDTGKLEKAKKTILYACIGLVITVLAFAIVNFTIRNLIGGESSPNNSQQDDEKDDSDKHTTPNANSANTPVPETK